jgi:hypothetical protein
MDDAKYNFSYTDNLTIEVLKGGFVLNYPVILDNGSRQYNREVFGSTRKLNQKLKEVLEMLSTVPVEGAE